MWNKKLPQFEALNTTYCLWLRSLRQHGQVPCSRSHRILNQLLTGAVVYPRLNWDNALLLRILRMLAKFILQLQHCYYYLVLLLNKHDGMLLQSLQRGGATAHLVRVLAKPCARFGPQHH